jgi:hypothetical protein
MNAQELWQAQALDAPRISLDYVRRRAASLEQRSRWRNAFDYFCCLVGVGLCVWQAAVKGASQPILAAGLVCFVLFMVIFAWRWHVTAGAASAPADAGVLDTLRFQRRELERQRDARRHSWRWWLPAMLPGVVLVALSLVIELDPPHWTAFWATVSWVVVGSAGGQAIYEYTARGLQREIDALDSLSR